MLGFDIETDGLLDDITKIHCIVIHDTEEQTTIRYNDEGTAEPLSRAVTILEGADCISGHNIIGYDIPAIKKVFSFFKPSGIVIDTLLLSRLYHPNILDIDQKHKWPQMPLQLYGRHSLEAYGYRLKCYKGCFSQSADWQEWSKDMEDYCEQDVKVTVKLCEHFRPYLIGSD